MSSSSSCLCSGNASAKYRRTRWAAMRMLSELVCASALAIRRAITRFSTMRRWHASNRSTMSLAGLRVPSVNNMDGLLGGKVVEQDAARRRIDVVELTRANDPGECDDRGAGDQQREWQD